VDGGEEDGRRKRRILYIKTPQRTSVKENRTLPHIPIAATSEGEMC